MGDVFEFSSCHSKDDHKRRRSTNQLLVGVTADPES
jgi:hypothetical protein